MPKSDVFLDLYAVSAAYAGYGMGLCAQYTDFSACELEEYRFPAQWLLHLDFNRESLTGTIGILSSAEQSYVAETFIDPDLGLGSLPPHGIISQTTLDTLENGTALYWATVANRIRALVQFSGPKIKQLLLTSPEVLNPVFISVVRDTLHDLVANSAPEMPLASGQNAKLVFTTARGAAKLAKRRQEGPVGCLESRECQRVMDGFDL